MIKVVITDCYAHPYETFVGVGIHRRSVKRAVELARQDIERQIRQGNDFAGSGVPILLEMRITRNGKSIETYDDGKTWDEVAA